jgi:hypothetical protein
MTSVEPLEGMSPEELARVDGHEVIDRDGESLGGVDVIFADEGTGQPEWLGLWNGIPFSERRIVPIRGAVHEGGVKVRVPYGRELVERAPSYHESFLHHHSEDSHITREQEQEAYALYGVEPLAPASTTDAAPRFKPVAAR